MLLAGWLVGMGGAAVAVAGLPTNHTWQATIRDHLGTFAEKDFAVTLEPFVYQPEFLKDAEEVYRVWVWMSNRAYDITETKGLRLPPSRFLLSAIEADGKINMCPAQNGYFDPMAVAWWSQWTYPGNPFRPGTANSLAAKRRAFAGAAVDMVMLGDLHDQGGGVRSDFMGGNLIWLSYTFLAVKDILPPPVADAYRTGLRQMFDRIETLTPHGGGGADIETFQLVGLWYAARAIGDTDLPDRALKRAHAVLDQIIKPAGYEHHGHAFDVAYMGIALRFVTWAALLHNDARIDRTLENMIQLKAYMTLPEPGGKGFQGLYNGPSHFSTGTAFGAPDDLWGAHFRDAAAAMKTDAAVYLVFGGRTHDYGPVGIKDEEAMRSDIARWASTINDEPVLNAGLLHPVDAPSPEWKEIHWTSGINYATELYRQGFYPRMVALGRANDPLALPPFARPGDFIKTFADDFLCAKIGGYGAIVHTDVVRDQWGGGIAGVSGGGLSAFWTPGSGTVILGLNGGSQLPTHERWELWRTWAVHAVSGENAGGKPFSSARNREPSNVVYRVNGNADAKVTFEGRIGAHDEGMSAPDGAIAGQVGYAREITLARDGMGIKTTVTSDGQDQVRELWEMIPLYIRRDGQQESALIEFQTGSAWQAAGETPVEKVTAVRITRFGRPVTLAFDRGRRVRMSGDAVQRGNGFTRTLMIDLLESGGKTVAMPAATSISYRIAP
jgi:hypothetical protein